MNKVLKYLTLDRLRKIDNWVYVKRKIDRYKDGQLGLFI